MISNPSVYELLYNHIAMERVSVTYLMIELYPSKVSDEDYRKLLENLETDCRRTKLNLVGEGGSLDNYLELKKRN